MTRTERSSFPRALQKDRHESRTGLSNDPNHIQKNGAGSHGWGSLDRALDDEIGTFDDEPEAEADEQLDEALADKPRPKAPRKESVHISDADRESALKVRQNALKGDGVDLGSIARSSAAVSTSPPGEKKSVPISRDTNALRDATGA